MSPYETIVMTAKPHGNGFVADLLPEGRTWGRPSIRAWYSRHPVNGMKAPVVWPPAKGDAQ